MVKQPSVQTRLRSLLSALARRFRSQEHVDFLIVIAVCVAAFYFAAAFDLNENWVDWTRSAGLEDTFELAELPLALSIAFAGAAWYALRRRRQYRAEAVSHEATLARLERALVQAHTASDAKSRFLASMSHELRTPLNAILGFSEIVKTEAFGPVGNAKYLEYVEDIHLSGTHLLNIINDVLDMARVEAGTLPMRIAPTDLTQVARQVERIIAQKAAAARLALELDIDPACRVLADEARLRQALLNLAFNAVKFTPPGGRIRIAGREDGERVRIEVSDTGIGIPPRDLPRVIEPFYQVQGTIDRRSGGTGLGLPLSKSLIELQSGSLALESTLNRGTTATIFLPAARRSALSGSASSAA
jgi:two-component system cell cycle sensor histidine kinase PleC